MPEGFDQFYSKFQVSEMEISRNRSWTWSLRPIQATIGSGILSLNRYAESMSLLSSIEGEDLVAMMRVIESTLKSAFNYQKINYLMLMMVDQHVHFHVIPRYSDVVTFNNKEWKDNGWAALPKLDDNKDGVARETLSEIRDFLKKSL